MNMMLVRIAVTQNFIYNFFETQNVNFFSRAAIICIRKQVMYVVKNAIDFQDYTCGTFEMKLFKTSTDAQIQTK